MLSFSRRAMASAFACGLSVLSANAQAAPDCGSGGGTIEYDYTGQIIICSIVSGGNYSLWAMGGNGGDQRIDNLAPTTFGGKSAAIGGVFALHAGDELRILVGGVGGTNPGELLSGEIYPGGGGGGTFVGIIRNNQPIDALLIAGGGGGASSKGAGLDGRGIPGSSDVPNGNGNGTSAGAGGTNGGGGGGSTTDTGGAGGGGFSGDGGNSQTATGGKSLLNGGAGGGPVGSLCFGAPGGFGGGGGAGWSDCASGGSGGGGGGGYDGGGGGGWYLIGDDGGQGGGGSSFYGAAYFVSNLTVQPGYHPFEDGNGQFLIQQLSIGEPAPVPEPASLALMGAALAGLGLARRRRA